MYRRFAYLHGVSDAGVCDKIKFVGCWYITCVVTKGAIFGSVNTVPVLLAIVLTACNVLVWSKVVAASVSILMRVVAGIGSGNFRFVSVVTATSRVLWVWVCWWRVVLLVER